MKKNKTFIITYILIFIFGLFLFPISGKADRIQSGTDKCVNDNTCLQVCEWNNNGYHAYAYYMLNTKEWKYVWYYNVKSERVSTTLPTKNIFYESSRLKGQLSSKGTCPASAYIDHDEWGFGSRELCFDSGKIVENKNGEGKTYCHKASNAGTVFKGTSTLIYSIDDQIDRYFRNNPMDTLTNTSCASLADSTGYVVDESKVQKQIDQVLIDYSHNFLYDNEMPDWMKNGSYKTSKEDYDRKMNLKVQACNLELREKAKQDLNAGIINEERFNQIVNNGSNVEQGVQDKLEELATNINSGNNPSNPNYKPNTEISNYGGTGDCSSLLGPKTTDYLKKGLTLIQVVGVVLAILLGMGDFIGALLSGENDSNKKAMKKFVVRIAVAAILLIVPALIKFLLDTFGVTNGGMCIL